MFRAILDKFIFTCYYKLLIVNNDQTKKMHDMEDCLICIHS